MNQSDEDEKLWRGASPGAIGWALYCEGRFLSRRDTRRDPNVLWWVSCPICSEEAPLYGPDAHDPLGQGLVYCHRCIELHSKAPPGFRAPSEGFKALFERWEMEHRPPVELADVLPWEIHLDLPQDEVVDQAFRALCRYGEDENPRMEEVIGDLAYWKLGKRWVDDPPDRILRALRKRQGEHNARRLVLAALERVTLKLGHSWAYLHELMTEEEELLRGAAAWLEWDEWNSKSVGHLLGKLALRRGEEGPGFRKRLNRGRHGCRWELVPLTIRWVSACSEE